MDFFFAASAGMGRHERSRSGGAGGKVVRQEDKGSRRTGRDGKNRKEGFWLRRLMNADGGPACAFGSCLPSFCSLCHLASLPVPHGTTEASADVSLPST
jgi:hypothetical protein